MLFVCWLIKFSFIACKSEKFYQVASTWDQYNKQKINPFIQRLLETQWTWPTSKGRWEAARKISIHGETPWGSETEPCVAINDTLQNLKSAKFASYRKKCTIKKHALNCWMKSLHDPPPQNLKSNHSTCIKKTCSQMLDEVTTDKNIFVFE